MVINNKADISIELEKIELLAKHLAGAIHDIQSYKDGNSEEKEDLIALYHIADTIRATANQAYAELYPEPPLNQAA